MLPMTRLLNDNAPEIVIAGGFKIDIQGNAVPVEGYDNCSLNTLQGSVDTDKSNCIVLIEHVKSTGSSSFVIRSRQRRMEDRAPKLKTKSGKNFIQTRMIRPDGNFVVPASSERGILVANITVKPAKSSLSVQTEKGFLK